MDRSATENRELVVAAFEKIKAAIRTVQRGVENGETPAELLGGLEWLLYGVSELQDNVAAMFTPAPNGGPTSH